MQDYSNVRVHDFSSNSYSIDCCNPLHGAYVSGEEEECVDSKVFSELFGFYNENYDIDTYLQKSPRSLRYAMMPKGYKHILDDINEGVVIGSRIMPLSEIIEMEKDILFLSYIKIMMETTDIERYLRNIKNDYEDKRDAFIELFEADGIASGGNKVIDNNTMTILTSKRFKFHEKIYKARNKPETKVSSLVWKAILDVLRHKDEYDETSVEDYCGINATLKEGNIGILNIKRVLKLLRSVAAHIISVKTITKNSVCVVFDSRKNALVAVDRENNLPLNLELRTPMSGHEKKMIHNYTPSYISRNAHWNIDDFIARQTCELSPSGRTEILKDLIKLYKNELLVKFSKGMYEDLLLNTSDKILQYRSSISEFGVDVKNGRGLNILGILLMELRRTMKQSNEKKETELKMDDDIQKMFRDFIYASNILAHESSTLDVKHIKKAYKLLRGYHQEISLSQPLKCNIPNSKFSEQAISCLSLFTEKDYNKSDVISALFHYASRYTSSSAKLAHNYTREITRKDVISVVVSIMDFVNGKVFNCPKTSSINIDNIIMSLKLFLGYKKYPLVCSIVENNSIRSKEVGNDIRVIFCKSRRDRRLATKNKNQFDKCVKYLSKYICVLEIIDPEFTFLSEEIYNFM